MRGAGGLHTEELQRAAVKLASKEALFLLRLCVGVRVCGVRGAGVWV